MNHPIELKNATPTPRRGLSAALIGFALIAGIGGALLWPGPSPVAPSDYAAQKGQLEERVAFARGYGPALSEIQRERQKIRHYGGPDYAARMERSRQAEADLDAAMLAQNQPNAQARVVEFVKTVEAHEARQASAAGSAALAIGAGLAGGVVLWLLLGTRVVAVRIEDAAVRFDGKRVPLADLRRVTWHDRRLVVEWEGQRLLLVARHGRLADLFHLEGLLQERVQSAEVQAEERAARETVQATHAQMMQQLERGRRAARRQRAESAVAPRG